MTDWEALTARAGIASHKLVGWIFWDPRGIENYAALGVPDGNGYYVATRAAPLAPAGANAVAASFYSISPLFLKVALDLAAAHTDWASVMKARDDAVAVGLTEVDPELPAELGVLAEPLWAGVDALPSSGRVLFAAHRDVPRPPDPGLSAWLAVNCLREWRGDTHWALCVAADLDMAEVGVLHGAYMGGYEDDWIARSRGADDAALDVAYERLAAKGYAEGREVNEAGRTFREELERRTDELCVQMWQAVGEETTTRLCEIVEPHADAFMARIDATAGPQWMPAARDRRA